MTETLWPTKPKTIYSLAPYRKESANLCCHYQLGNLGAQGGGGDMFQKEGNELKFGHKGSQIKTSVKKLRGKKDKL